MKNVMIQLICWLALVSPVHADDRFQWEELELLPNTVGVAGPFVGVYNDVLIVAGGANFPDKRPWDGGVKVWWDDIHVMERGSDGMPEWIRDADFKLPKPLAYGVAISIPQGILLIGGCDAERCYDDVMLLQWDSDAKQIHLKALPPMPRPLAFMAGALVGNTVYIAGGQEVMQNAGATKNFFALNLDVLDQPDQLQWRELPPWPGPARVVPTAVGQINRDGPCFYLFSGRDVQPGHQSVMLTDMWVYNTVTEEWKTAADVGAPGGSPQGVQAASVVPFGEYHFLVFSGGLDSFFMEAEELGERIRQTENEDRDPELIARLKAENVRIHGNHPGFTRDVLAYHTITDTWTTFDRIATGQPPVTTAAVQWGDDIILPSGEVSPGIRSPQILSATLRDRNVQFGGANWTMLILYILALVGMGFYFARREKGTEDFFLAGKRIPWWAAGLSIFGTQLSALTFMAIPAVTFRLDWLPALKNWTIVLITPIVVLFFLPFFCRLKVTTAYEYLEKRFNVAVRLYGSLSFILYQLGRMGVVILLPAIALSAVTGIDTIVAILVMGILSTLYTALGGIEAVIWTDVLQVVVLLGGALYSLLYIGGHVDGGFAGILQTAAEYDKLRMVDWSWDLTRMSVSVMVFGTIIANLVPYTTDQTVVQRYLTTKNETEARRSVWTNAVITIPATLLFFGMGTALFAYYRQFPGLMTPDLSNDAIFPYFIHQNLPPALAGVVIAGVFAAAMSSLDSSMNSIATAITTDFYRRFKAGVSDHQCFVYARWVTLGIGVLGTTIALVMASFGGAISSLWFLFEKLLGLLGGGLFGVFMLAFFAPRVNGTAALAGALVGSVVQIYVAFMTPVHFFLYALIGGGVCYVTGLLVSVVTGPTTDDLTGLTVFTKE